MLTLQGVYILEHVGFLVFFGGLGFCFFFINGYLKDCSLAQTVPA